MDGVSLNETGLESTDEVILRMRRAIRAANKVVDPVAQAPAPQPAPSVANISSDTPAVGAAISTSDTHDSEMAEPMPAVPAPKPLSKRSLKTAAMVFLLATALATTAVWKGNRAYGPEMYGYGGMEPAAEANAKGLNYAVFDLNLNIRALREGQIKRWTQTPDVILMGASHWQEGDASIAPGINFFNSHIHRDYWEDLLGMVNLFTKYDRLPKHLIIAIRENQFTPVDLRKDFLWEPGIPSYREMTKRLGIKAQPFWKTLPYDRMRALLSLPMLFENLTRWHNATERPHASTQKQFDTLDTLLPDGSIVWSRKHLKMFSQERMMKEVEAFVAFRRNTPPVVDEIGLAHFEKTLEFLKERGVTVSLIKPPFNPLYYDAVEGTPYKEGLRRIEKLIDDLAARHGLKVLGSYNPHDIGCTKEMYIDAEHSNSTCLKKVFAPFVAEYTQKNSSR